jgi:hypothetical protein
VAAGCVAFAVLAFAFGALVPWPFVQDVVGDLIGGLLAGLVLFGLANIAFGFTERRESKRHALRIAYDMVFPELMDNQAELQRIAQALREGSLTLRDPVFGAGERLKAENWRLLVQSPLGAHLPPDIFWQVNWSYYVSRRFVRELKETNSGVVARTPEAWK